LVWRSRIAVVVSTAALGLFVGAIAFWIWLEKDARNTPSGLAEAVGQLVAEPVSITAPMAGRVTSYVVNPGETVEAGADLAVLQPEESGSAPIRLSAPRAGRVEMFNKFLGEFVSRGETVTTVVSDRDLRFVAEFPGSSMPWLKLGAEARILLKDVDTSVDRIVIPGQISALWEHSTEPPGDLNATVTVVITVTDLKGAPLKAGLAGRVYVRTEEGAVWPARVL
jgi:pyruvate/2-oxoglutarate dehydrogenase complex dihydrolipoamide acyltransferase (E2) component